MPQKEGNATGLQGALKGAAFQVPPKVADPQPELAEEESEQEGDEEDDTPPREFAKDARAILPTASQRMIYAAWDRSRGIGAGADKTRAYDSGSARVQAALGFLFDAPDLPVASTSSALAQASPATPPEPLFRPESASPEPPMNRKRRDSVIVLGSDDDHDDPPPRKLANKGKGRAVDSLDEVEIVPSPRKKNIPIVNLVDDDSDEEMAPPPVRRARPPTPQLDPEDAALAAILVIVPDVLPSHVLMLLRSEDFAGNADRVVEALWVGEYPKSDVKCKGKGKKRARSDSEDGEGVVPDYLDLSKRKVPDVHYKAKALDQLYNDFDLVSATFIKAILKGNQFFYSPAYLALRAAVKAGEAEMIAKRRTDKKAKDEPELPCAELEKEKDWLRTKILKEREDKKTQKRQKLQEELDAAAGLLLECGCCFTEFIAEVMVQCADGHLFCKECAINNADAQIGLRQYKLPCMSGDECSAEFTINEARKFLPETSIAALLKIRQEKEIDEAELFGLSKCPFCPYAYVIDNPDEKLFHCARDGCEVVSCRQCKKVEHLPFSCKEWEEKMDKDKKIDSIHKVEEAMTQALIRHCPKCKEPYVKSDGCNKITCSNCHAHSCYVCGKLTGSTYNHWAPLGSKTGGCPQFDDTEMRNFNEVEEARKAAAAKIAQENPAIDADDVDPLKLVQPNRDAAPPGGPRGAHVNHGFLPGNFDHDAHFAALRQAQQAALNAMAAAGAWGAGGFGGLFGGGYGGNGGVQLPNPPQPLAGPAPRAAAPVVQPTPAQLRARAAAAAERRLMK